MEWSGQIFKKYFSWYDKLFTKNINTYFESQNIKVEVSGEGFEAAARLKRMNILKSLPESSLIIQGHHSDDQIETVLFRIIRGTGLKGISGIPRVAKVGENKILKYFKKLCQNRKFNW